MSFAPTQSKLLAFMLTIAMAVVEDWGSAGTLICCLPLFTSASNTLEVSLKHSCWSASLASCCRDQV